MSKSNKDKNQYVSSWMTKAQFLEKYDIFTPRYLTRLITIRHENGFSICCKLLGNRAMIHDGLLQAWIMEQDEDKAVA